MIGIFYFSSTGNSLYISEMIRQKMGGKVIYIPTYTGNGGEFDKIIVVSPIYSFGLPVHVYDFLPRLDKERELFVVLNYGGMVGGADHFVYRYARQNGLNVKGVFTLKMPENYTLTFTVPKFYLKRVLDSADKRIDKRTIYPRSTSSTRGSKTRRVILRRSRRIPTSEVQPLGSPHRGAVTVGD